MAKPIPIPAIKSRATTDAKAPDGRVVRAQRQRESRKAALVVVARRVFSEKGYHSTSIDDLIEAAGVARGTFYLYFESKRAIFEHLLDELFATLQGIVRRIDVAEGAVDPLVQMDALVDKIFATLVEHREIARILLREAVGIDADFDRKLGDFYGRIERLLERALETGMELGIVRPCRPELVGRCILGAVKEVVHHAFVTRPELGALGPTTTITTIDTNLLGREVIAFTLRGVWALPVRP